MLKPFAKADFFLFCLCFNQLYNEPRIQNQDQKLAQEYQAAAQDKKRWKEAQEWEQVQIADWSKKDGGEND